MTGLEIKALHPPYQEAVRRWGVAIATTQACMRGFENWPVQQDIDGLKFVSCPCMGLMAISPRYGHPVSVAQARREDDNTSKLITALLRI